MNHRRRAPFKRTRKGSTSKHFNSIFDGGTTLVQRQIVEQALVPFLDTISHKDAKRVIKKTRRIARQSNKLPQVDMSAKKTEINGLLDELAKDVKLSTRSNGSKFDVLLLEVTESIAQWLNDLWSLTCEFGLDFPRAHACLLFSMGVLDHVQSMRSSGCHCVFSNLYVPVTIRDRAGKVVREFTELGLSNLESAILWVWRDVFLALLASMQPPFIRLVPELLAEIDDVVGWQGLAQLLRGSKTVVQPTNSLLGHEQKKNDFSSSNANPEFDDGNNLDVLYGMCHTGHWNHKLIGTFPTFSLLVKARMLEIFRAAPSLQLYGTLMYMARYKSEADEVDAILSRLATTSATTLSTALQIYATEDKPDKVAALLSTHAFLLRPRDSKALQCAVRTLAGSPTSLHRAMAIAFTNDELINAARNIRHACYASFSRMDSPTQQTELGHIMKLRRGTDERQERIESWVESSTTPGMGPPNPMAFAAMMMGLAIAMPVPGALGAFDTEDAAHLGLMDLDPHDPDFADLREEYRPDLKGRFEEWVNMAEVIGARIRSACREERGREPGGEGLGFSAGGELLDSVYRWIKSRMPYATASDIVHELISRISDRPSKHHVCDALEALATFAKAQRKKGVRNFNALASVLAGVTSSPMSPTTALHGPAFDAGVNTDEEDGTDAEASMELPPVPIVESIETPTDESDSLEEFEDDDDDDDDDETDVDVESQEEVSGGEAEDDLVANYEPVAHVDGVPPPFAFSTIVGSIEDLD